MERVLKGNGGLGGHVMKIGHFGLKKFLDPDLVYRISVILITSGAKTLEKIVWNIGELTAGILILRIVQRGLHVLQKKLEDTWNWQIALQVSFMQ